jgi:magnesium transporter
MKKPLFINRQKSQAGKPPGTLVHIGDRKTEEARITLISYDQTDQSSKTVTDLSALKKKGGRNEVRWINVDGLHDVELVRDAGEIFGIHPLLLEDVLNTSGRVKIDAMGDHILIVLRMFSLGPDGIESEQVSFLLGDNTLISFQERPGDVFNPVRERIAGGTGRIRGRKADYLMYALLDVIVDQFYQILEYLSGRIDTLEDEILDNPRDQHSQEIHVLKKDLLYLRRNIWPLRVFTSFLHRNESGIMDKETLLFFRDVHDHVIYILDYIDTFRDVLTGLQETLVSSLSNRMNAVMKVLTLIATIFIPLTFIAGIYGMNFQNMPELAWKWGYFAVLGIMGLTTMGMLIFFKIRKWL